MATISEALALAIEHHKSGNLPAAEQLYRRILAVNPDHSDALHLLGVIAHQVGNHDLAVRYIEQAIVLRGTEAAYYNNLGEAYRSLRMFAQAVQCYQRALQLQPNYAEAHNNLGLAWKDLGQVDDAVACFARAFELRPECVSAHDVLLLGIALQNQGKVDNACRCYRRALELRPDYAEAYNNLGSVLAELGQKQEAIANFQRAIEIKPSLVEAYNNLGNALKDLGKLDEAVDCFRQALNRKPNFAEAHYNLGIVERKQGLLDASIASFRRSLELQPNLAQAYNNLANALKDQGRLDEAVACFRKAVELKPDFLDADSNLVYTLLFCPAYDNAAIHRELRRWNRQHAEPLAAAIQPVLCDTSPERRLRIGYVSPNFRDHVVGRYLLPLFQSHDHRRYETVCYSDVMAPDLLTERFRSCSDGWRNCHGITDKVLAETIRADRIDILVDLTLHMAHSRLLTFARKPAPVQVAFAGYPGTTGMSTIDYRLTDRYLDPPDSDLGVYSEQSLYLPDTFFCYDPLTDHPAVVDLPTRQRSHITFGSLNNFCKVNAQVLKIWAQVLRKIDRSHLVLLAAEGSHRAATLELLAREGVQPERVEFVTSRPRPQYLELYHGIDLGLDTFPYNGHATSWDAFWMGVPVITLVGKTAVGRGGLSMLMNLGLPELVAWTPDEFVRIAVELARDLPRLADLRRGLRERMQRSPLMDGPRFARGVEAAYRTMWKNYCATPGSHPS